MENQVPIPGGVQVPNRNISFSILMTMMARVPRMNRLSPFINNRLGKGIALERSSTVGLDMTMTNTVGHGKMK